jgi:hypothetical protein
MRAGLNRGISPARSFPRRERGRSFGDRRPGTKGGTEERKSGPGAVG